MPVPEKNESEPYNVSKWLSVCLLIDAEEMRSLYDAFGVFLQYLVGNIVKKGWGDIPHETFLSAYSHYVDCLKNGKIPEDGTFRSLFASVLTVSEDHVYALNVGHDKQIIRVSKPVIQMQSHHLDYSAADGKFRSMVMGKDSILWGVQFSYPQLYEDATHHVYKVDTSDLFPNTRLFRTLQNWIRQHTVPTPFIVDGIVHNVPIRLGKNCFSWINQHPQLVKKGLKVSSWDYGQKNQS